MIGECRSNEFLDESCRFSTEQEELLRALGWKEAKSPWTPNWHFEACDDSEVHALSLLAQHTLHDVFGLAGNDLIVVGMQRRFLETDPPT